MGAGQAGREREWLRLVLRRIGQAEVVVVTPSQSRGADAQVIAGAVIALKGGKRVIFLLMALRRARQDAIDGVDLFTLAAAARYGLHLMVGLPVVRSEEHTSELQSLMRTSYAVF